MAWNPAAGQIAGGVSGGLEVLHTSSVLGLSGFGGAVTTSVGPRAGVGVVLGRIDIRDLVRTTTSPSTVGGSIPVYTQYAGLGGQLELRSFRVGTLIRINNEQFDVIQETGATLDFGLRWKPIDRLTIAAATHFLPLDFSKQVTTDYYAGIEYLALRSLPIGSISADVLARYGLNYRSYDALEHTIGAGMNLGTVFGVNAAVTRESAYGSGAWRPALSLFLKVGRYEVDLASSSGLNDVGATYRVGLSIDFVR
ncbi:MAG: hypothetical protein JSW51_13160 [Gemmatimonadota bacterium]|nr:MAG: hypothetical protein JSW51_13160 [Gemmatimonadota bacterium]